jgi:hypothetical protein
MTPHERSGTRRGFAVLVLATVGWVTPCHAQSSEATRTEARERFDRGLRLFNQQDNQGALAEFLRAYELVPHPLVLYNVGLVYATMGRAVDAQEAFDRLLAAPAGLDAEKLARVHAERARQAVRIAEIEVVSSVPDAIVDLDGVEAGRTPLAAPLRVDSGQHIVGVVAAGHEPLRKSVTLAGQTRTRLEFALVPRAAQLAHLALTSRVPGLEVFVNGERVGTTPLPASLALAPGAHRIELRRPGYATSVRSVELGPGSSGRLDVDPPVDVAALVHAGGDLALRISEPSAVVFIDGESRGAYRAPLRLPAGEHLLRVERSDFFPFQRRVDVPRGGRTDVVVELEPTPDERARYRSVNERMRLWGWVGVGAGAALAAGGTGFLIWNQGEKSGAERAHRTQRARWTDGRSCDPMGEQDPDCEVALELALDDLDAARKRDAFGWVGLGVGAAALGTGVVLLLSSDDPDRYEPRPESDVFGGLELVPRAWIAPSAYGIGAAGRF